jgi:hypothetical protein
MRGVASNVAGGAKVAGQIEGAILAARIREMSRDLIGRSNMDYPRGPFQHYAD